MLVRLGSYLISKKKILIYAKKVVVNVTFTLRKFVGKAFFPKFFKIFDSNFLFAVFLFNSKEKLNANMHELALQSWILKKMLVDLESTNKKKSFFSSVGSRSSSHFKRKTEPIIQ